MSCSKISECLVPFVSLNYLSPANLESAGDDHILLGKGPIHAFSRDILTWSRHFRLLIFLSVARDNIESKMSNNLPHFLN